ncbi:hypothetical protein F5X68DRAFT_8804 [Plectosphaerella plurivora]|uniref:Secreted protein n=1 Tax=Plectosphaerella plurivora TaxID=936078 RepID=A0A9P8VCG9_9PEZI|nr:hypothetical protein F5X68DRAFT_8804 [Plectosphaerella plurivora]
MQWLVLISHTMCCVCIVASTSRIFAREEAISGPWGRGLQASCHRGGVTHGNPTGRIGVFTSPFVRARRGTTQAAAANDVRREPSSMRTLPGDHADEVSRLRQDKISNSPRILERQSQGLSQDNTCLGAPATSQGPVGGAVAPVEPLKTTLYDEERRRSTGGLLELARAAHQSLGCLHLGMMPTNSFIAATGYRGFPVGALLQRSDATFSRVARVQPSSMARR